MAGCYSFFGFLLKKAIFKNKMFHLGTKRRRVYWYRTLYVSVWNRVFELIIHSLALNYRTLKLTIIMALHVFLGDEPLTEGIRRCLVRVKGMAEMTWKHRKWAFPGKTLHTNSGRRAFPLFDAQYAASYNRRSRFPVWCILVTLFFDAF